MALPQDMRLKGHRTFDYIHKNSKTYYGKLMTFKVARSNPDILLTHKVTNTSNNFRVAIAISKKVSKKAVERNKLRSYTAILSLPFCLLHLITLLPVWERILTLNPDTRFLFLEVPPKVLLVICLIILI